MRVLVVSAASPLEHGNGSELQVWNVIRNLRKAHEVRVLCLGDVGDPLLSDAHVVAPVVFPTLRRHLVKAQSLLAGEPFLVRQIRASGMLSAVVEELASFPADVIYVTNSFAGFVADLDTAAPKVLNAIDSWSLNEAEVYASEPFFRRNYGRLVVRSVRRYEAASIRRFASVIVVSTRDRDHLLELAPGVDVRVISNGVDTDYFHPRTELPEESAAGPPCVVFHGTMDYPPNVLGAEYLIGRVMPHVWERRPEVRVVLAGRSPSPRVMALRGERVEVTGALDDIRPALWNADLSVFPVITGSGVKNKVLEAAALARPMVATPSAIGDLRLSHDRHALIAADEGEFAGAVLELLDDPARGRRLGLAARQVVTEQHSWESVARDIAGVCEDALRSGGSARGLDERRLADQTRHPERDPLTVLHVSQPTDAGVATVVANLVADQVKRGWQVHVATPVTDGDLARHCAAHGAQVHPWAATRGPGPSVLRESSELARIIRTCRPDVVHLHSSKAGLAGRLAIRGRIPTIFQPHAWSFEAVTGATQVASRAWERIATRWTDVTLCVSEAEKTAGREAHCLASTAVVIPNGVRLPSAVDAGQDRSRARELVGLDPAVPVAVLVGRLARQKGQDVAIAAWPKVRARLPFAELILVGDGPDRADLESLAGDAAVSGIRLVGAADPAPYYQAADVVLLPSRWEGMPLVLLEAMSWARPVVCADVTGMRDCTGDGDHLVPVDDPDAVASAVLTRLESPEAAAEEGRRHRVRVAERFTLDVATDAVARLTADMAAEAMRCRSAGSPRARTGGGRRRPRR